jgi:hypothetical protein
MRFAGGAGCGGYPERVATDSTSAPTEAGAPAGDAPAGGVTRYRCVACGNLTRFNVVTSSRTKAFHHYSVGGELSVEDVEVLDESVDEVSCRWCGNGGSIEIIQDESVTDS